MVGMISITFTVTFFWDGKSTFVLAMSGIWVAFSSYITISIFITFMVKLRNMYMIDDKTHSNLVVKR